MATITSASIPSSSLVPIFRSPESLFASGEMTQKDLRQKRVNYSVKQWQQIRWNKQTFWIPEDRFLQPIELSKQLKVTAQTLLLKSPYGFANVVTKLKAGDLIRALDYQDDWVQVHVEKNGEKSSALGWLPLFFVEPTEDDRGYLYTRYNSYLFQIPSGHSKVLTPIPFATRLDPINWDSEWVKVQYGKNIGYVPLNHVIGRIHFAEKVLYEDKWYAPDVTDFPAIGLRGYQKKVNLLSLRGFQVESLTKGMVLTDKLIGYKDPSFQAETIKLDSAIIASLSEMLQYQYQTWQMSITTPHGPVWWSPADATQTGTPSELIPTPELLRRPIHALASHPKNSDQSVLSARGVYLTQDGKLWKKLSQFGDQNLPVAINRAGHIFVGDKWSDNQGESFKPYIRWDELTQKLALALSTSPQSVRIENLEPHPLGPGISVKLHTGNREFTAKGTPGGNDWLLIR